MKIKNSKIFTADIWESYNYRYQSSKNSENGWDNNKIIYDKKLIVKNAIVVKFANYYVPVKYVDSVFKYLDVKSHVSVTNVKAPDKRFFLTVPALYQNYFVKNVHHFTERPGKTDTKSLLKFNEINCERVSPSELQI